MRFVLIVLFAFFIFNVQGQQSPLAVDTFLLKDYYAGRLDHSQMPRLARMERIAGRESIAKEIARDYSENYLEKKADFEILTKENIRFMAEFPDSSEGRIFKLFYRFPELIDSIMKKRAYAATYIDFIIYNKYVYSKLLRPGTNEISEVAPDWNSLHDNIENRYSMEIADRNILNAKIKWYSVKKDWENIARFNIEKIRMYGIDTGGIGLATLNNMFYDVIFEHCNDRPLLEEAIKWMAIVVEASHYSPTKIDTYACLLYKFGKKEEALHWESKAAGQAPQNGDIKKNFEQMKNGSAIW
jgi:hypothetical protein